MARIYLPNLSEEGLESAIKSYNPDKDIEESGGLEGIGLANELVARNPSIIDRGMLYREFLSGSTRITGVNSKRRLLETCFPEKYGNGGETPISEMSDISVNRAYAGKLGYVRKLSNRRHN